MRHVVLLGSLVVAGAVAVACGDANTTVLGASGGAASSSGGAILDDGGTTAQNIDGGAGTGTTTGLPCDVQKVLEDGCIACHGGAQSPRLLTYGDLTAQSTQYAGQTVAQRSLARMQAGTMPPAPAVPPTPAEITSFSNWVAAGTPQGGTCTNLPDGGGGGTNNTNTPPVCTSGKQGTTGQNGSMDPGRACLACHQQQGGPRFAVGGTVYPTAHEPDQCVGIGGLNVVITDSAGTVTTLPVQSSGNFCSSSKCGAPSGLSIVPPFSAKLVNPSTGATRAMAGTITAGDCNGCHTQNGANGAPGRIFAP
jgi:mono/diheme cytochrome c family protein